MTRIFNFGRNIEIRPSQFVQPQSEAEVLELIEANVDRKIRCIGRLHSWSDVVTGDDVVLDLRNLLSNQLVDSDTAPMVRVGAGSQIKQIVEFLNGHGLTLPTLGLIDEQSIAGAISTGTHGSGRHSLSHYVQAVRLVSLDQATGKAIANWVNTDDFERLRAARCSLGCLGVITEVELPTRRQYQIEEHFRRYEKLAEVLDAESTYDLQQFYFIPWRWDFFAQHRVEVGAKRSWHARLYRAFWAAGMDVGLHILIWLLARLLPSTCTPFFFRNILTRLVPINWKVVDRSDRQLTMQHERFRHIEVEMFVPAKHLAESLECVRDLLEHFADREDADKYVHHYPICIRKVLPDDTLISPASVSPALGEEPWYAVSFISYARPAERAGFEAFARELTSLTIDRFQARPHWGKHCPIDRESVARIYPNWEQFVRLVRDCDTQRTFTNSWLEKLMSNH